MELGKDQDSTTFPGQTSLNLWTSAVPYRRTEGGMAVAAGA